MRFFVTGYVLGSHGLDGTFKVKSASGDSAHIVRLKEMTLRRSGEERTVKVESAEAVQGCILMKVQGVNTPEAARLLTGCEIVVSEDLAHQKADGEWYVDDLCGCVVVYGDEGVLVGRVINVAEGAAGSLLEVEIDGGCVLLDESVKRTKSGKARRVMVPFTDEYIGDVDTEKGRMQLRHLWVLE